MENIQEQTIRGYQLHELLATGGMGEVYRATQTVVGREVVIKKILPKYANQPEFIRRFEAEAKLVAQLDHLHIAPLYDYWRDPSGAYLVMRFLRGGTLRDSVRETGPWSPRAVVRLLNQIGAALTVAHRRNVVHRDIKPANILLDDDANAYLTDFGIALEMTDEQGSDSGSAPQSVTGSAGYISPEQINLQSLTPRADVYSMALVIYEALTGQHPYPDAKSAIALFLKHVNEPLPEMQNYPPGVNEVMQKAAAKEPEDRYESMLAFASAFKKSIMEADISVNVGSDVEIEDFDTTTFDLTASEAVEDVSNPYKGLAAFQEGDAADFFGRDQLIQTLLDKMDEDHPLHRFLAVVGPSGSGKSSVVKAGLLPALRKGSLPNSENWFVVQMIPGTSPLTELEDALMRVAINPIPNLKESLQDHGALVGIVDSALPDDGSELVIVIDQFEETFTTGSDREREDFLQSLYQAVIHEDSRLRLIITLRADFYDRPLGVQNFSGLMQQRTEVVIPFTPEELEKTITGPARRVKVFFQQGLAAQIVSEVSEQPGVLPMLQYALTELFARREGPIIMMKDYQEIGGVLGALAQQAEEMYQSLDEEQREATRQLFLRLVTLGEGTEDTRRRALQSEIMSAYNNVEIMNGVISQFSSKRLLTTDRDPVTRSPTVEVAHEALIREWGTLKVWLDEGREDVRLQRMLLGAAQEWQEANNDDSFLLRGGRLVTFEEWIDQSTIAVAELERTYLNASLKERDRLEAEEAERIQREQKLQETNARRLRYIVAGSIIAAIIGVALAFFALTQSEAASVAAADAQTQAAIAATSESNANENAVTATFAQGDAIIQANNAQTQEALALVAQEDAIVQANNAQTQEALALVAQEDALLQADLAATSEAEAIIAGDDAVENANNAGTQAALAATAQQDALVQADLAATSAADAFLAQQDAEAQADIAATSESQAIIAQAEAQIAADRAQSLALASFASQFSESNVPLSIALALEANEIEDAPIQAQRVLISVAYEGPRKLLLGDFGGVRDIATIVLPEENLDTDLTISDRTIYLDESMNFRVFVAYDTGMIVEWNPELSEVVQTFEAHNSPVTSMDVYANDDLSRQWIVSSDQSGRIILWDVLAGTILREFAGHTSVVNTVNFRPDGQRIVSASDDGNAIIWNSQTGDSVRLINTAANSSINSAVFSPNGNNLLILTDDAMRLIGASSDQFLEFGIGDDDLVRDGEETNRIRSAVFSPNGEFIVTTGSAGSSRPEIWDTSTRRLLRVLSEHNGPVNSVSVSEDNQFVLSGSDDFTVILSAVASGDEIRSYYAHQNRVSMAIFTDADARVLSGSTDGEIFLWDKLPTSRTIESYEGHDAGVDTIAQLPSNQDYFLSTSASGELSFWNGVSGTLMQNYRRRGSDAPQTVLAIEPMSTLDNIIVGLGSEDIEIREFNSNTTIADIEIDPLAEYLFVDPLLVENQWVNALEFSPDGRYLLSGGGFFVRSQRGEGQAIFQGEDTVYPILHLWDAVSGGLVHQYDTTGFVIEEGFDAPVTAIAFSPDGNDVMSGIEDGRLVVWSSISGSQSLTREFTGHSARITSIEFSQDGTQLLTASNDRAIILWDYESGRLLRRFTGHRGAVNDVKFSPNGNQILSGADDTGVILWDIETGNSIQRFSEQDTPITSVAFIKDGRVVVSGALDGSIVQRQFDTGSGLIQWARNNRYIPELGCDERQRFNLACSIADGSSSSTG